MLRGTVNLSAPVSGRISSPFGPRVAPAPGASTDHRGIDYSVPIGTPVRAAAPGVVVYAQWQAAGGGNTIKIEHADGYVTAYAHLSTIAVALGQQIAAGQVIGASGDTGIVSGPNLHFGLSINGMYVNPVDYLGGAPTSAPPLISTAPPAGSTDNPASFSPAHGARPVVLIPLPGCGTDSLPSLVWLSACLPDTLSSTPSAKEAVAELVKAYGVVDVFNAAHDLMESAVRS